MGDHFTPEKTDASPKKIPTHFDKVIFRFLWGYLRDDIESLDEEIPGHFVLDNLR